MIRQTAQSKGMLLVVMVGILTLLMMISVMFISLTKGERKQMGFHSDHIRAKLLARSGLEYAVARLVDQPDIPGGMVQTSPEEDWRYRDEPEVTLEQSRNLSYNADPYQDIDSNGRYSDGDAYRDPDGNGRYDGVSGRLRGTYSSYSERFKLRIEDPSGKICVNGNGTGLEGEPFTDANSNGAWDPQDPFRDLDRNGVWDLGEPFSDMNGNNAWDDAEPFTDRNQNGLWDGSQTGLVNLINGLCDVLGIGEPLGEKIVSGSPYRSMEDLEKRVGKTTFSKLAPYVTLHGRGKPALRPVGERVPADAFLYPGATKWESWRSVRHFQATINRILWPLSREERVPISVNLASKEVLKSAFLPLEAVYLERNCRILGELTHVNYVNDSSLLGLGAHSVGHMQKTDMRPEAAEWVAQGILLFRELNGGFRTWREWEEVLSFLSGEEGRRKLLLWWEGQTFFGATTPLMNTSLKENEQYLITANSIPNSRLNKFNPNAVLNRMIDKSDLTVWTTELSLESSGLFEIASLGEIYDTAGLSQSSSWRVNGVVSLWEQWHESTQRDFSSGSISSNSNPVQAPSYRNRSLQLYPEPETSHHGVVEWDGYVMLATNRVEPIRGDEAEEWLDPTLLFYSRYEAGLSADYSRDGGNLTCFPETEDWYPEGWPDPNPPFTWNLENIWFPQGFETPTGRPNENSIVAGTWTGGEQNGLPEYGSPDSSSHVGNPGSLYPDGVYSDSRNVPAYEFENNFESEAGVISFWMKLNGTATKHHILCSFSYHPFRGFSVGGEENPSRPFAIGMGLVDQSANVSGGGGNIGFNESLISGMVFEPTGDDADRSVVIQKVYPSKGMWVHMGGAWDQRRSLPAEQAFFHYNEDVPPSLYEVSAPRGGTDFDFTQDDGDNRRRFRFGDITRRGDRLDGQIGVLAGTTYSNLKYSQLNQPPCSTIDEFCIYGRQGGGGVEALGVEDAAGAGPEHMLGAQEIWREHYLHGRYYNQGDAVFNSAPRKFEPGTRFLTMSWTTLYPDGEYDSVLGEGQNLFPGLDVIEEDVGVRRNEGDGISPQWRILLDFFDGEKWLLDLDGNGKLSPEEERRARLLGLTDEGGVPLNRTSQMKAVEEMIYASSTEKGLIRYRAYFKKDADWLSTPLLESPVLDDVTITYMLPTGPKWLKYSE